jgi:hypothetical protein
VIALTVENAYLVRALPIRPPTGCTESTSADPASRSRTSAAALDWPAMTGTSHADSRDLDVFYR